MKKSLLILSFCLLLVGAARAGDGLYLAPKFGMNFSNFTGLKQSGFSPGFNVGLSGGIDFAFIGVEASAMYSRVTADLSDNTKVHSNYISVPVVARLYFLDLLYISAGPQFDFHLSSTVKVDSQKTSSPGSRKALVSGVVGCGLQFSQFGLGFTYNIGFTNVFTNMFDQFQPGTYNAKNQNMALCASWRF